MKTLNFSRGLIRLSYRQAESAPKGSAPLCFPYIAALLAAALCLAFWLRGGGKERLPLCAAVIAAALSVGLRADFFRKAHEVTERFLITQRDWSRRITAIPAAVPWIGFQTALLALKGFLFAALLSPAVCCLRLGSVYYSLSGQETAFMLALNAALCFGISGILLWVMLTARFACAEFLLLRGISYTLTDALETSWRLTEDRWSETVAALWLSTLCGARIAALCRLNLSELLAEGFIPSRGAQEWHIEVVKSDGGERLVELTPLF